MDFDINILLAAKVLTSVFLSILFLQSGLDKVIDWKGNHQWLKGHFASSVLKDVVKPLLISITLLELTAGSFSAFGAIYLIITGNGHYALLGILFSAISLICLFFGQRIAKDYEGALSLAIYFILSIIGLLLYK